MNKIKKIRVILFFSILFFVISLFQMGFCTARCENDGFTNLFLGWLSIVTDPVLFVIWLANPLLFFAWIFLNKKEKISFKLSVSSLILILSFLFCNKVAVSESGVFSPVTSIRIGYWLWVFSSLITVIGSCYLIKKNKE